VAATKTKKVPSGKRPTAITKLQDTPSEGKRNWLIYAPSGVGKTVLAGTAPKAIFLTVEAAGTESAKALGSEADELVINSWDELLEAYYWLKKEKGGEYDWVIIDSLTEMEELCWNDQLEKIGKEFEARIQDYGIVDRKVKKLVDQFNRLPINVLYTAQQASMEVEDEDGDDITKVLPALGRAKGGYPLSSLICGKVTLVGLLIVREDDDDKEERRLYVHGGERWVAKDRHDTFGKFIKNPNIEVMADAVSSRQAAAGPRAATTTKKKKKESA
jgi:phage nucleotide-binding protein